MYICNTMSRLENSSINMKIIQDESGKMIQTTEGILCEYVDSDGNTTLKFVRTNSCCTESSSEIESEGIMCNTALFNYEIPTQEKKNSHGTSWEDSESKELLQLYYENIKQIGPFSTFRNKKCMWEFISNELTKKYGTFRSPLQCEYRYKNMLEKRNAAKKNNKRSGNEKCNIAFEEEFELINNIDDSIEPDVRFSIGQCTVKKRKMDALSSEEADEEVERKVKISPNIFAILRDINNEKEKQKERRHKEKIEVLRELFSANNK